MSGLTSRGAMFAAGVGVGVYGMVKARRVQEALTPDGLRDRGRSLALGAKMLRAEVAQARTDKETELRDRMGLRTVAARPNPQNDTLAAPQAPAAPALESRGQH